MTLLDFDTRDNIRKRQSQAFRARATQAAQRQAEARRRILAQKDAKLFRKEATTLTQQVTQRRTDSQGFRADAMKLVDSQRQFQTDVRKNARDAESWDELRQKWNVSGTKLRFTSDGDYGGRYEAGKNLITLNRRLIEEDAREMGINPIAWADQTLRHEVGHAVRGTEDHGPQFQDLNLRLGGAHARSGVQRDLSPLRTTRQLERQEYEEAPRETGIMRTRPEQFREAARAREESTATPVQQLGLEALRTSDISPLDLATSFAAGAFPAEYLVSETGSAVLGGLGHAAESIGAPKGTSTAGRVIGSLAGPEMLTGAGRAGLRATGRAVARDIESRPGGLASEVGGSRFADDAPTPEELAFGSTPNTREGLTDLGPNLSPSGRAALLREQESLLMDLTVMDPGPERDVVLERYKELLSDLQAKPRPRQSGNLGPGTYGPGPEFDAPAPRTPEEVNVASVDDVPNTPEVSPIQKMTTWLNESKGAIAKGRTERRAQVTQLRKQQAAALGEAYDNPSLTEREMFETGTKNLAGTAGTTATGPPPINEEEVGSLLAKIRTFPLWQNRRFKARNAQSGLLKLMGGELPDQSELKLLEQVFGPDFAKAASITDANGWREVGAASALTRTVRTILDHSWLWRQGIGVHSRHPEVYKNAAIGARALVDPKFARQWDEAVRMKPGIVKLVGDDGVDATWTVGELQDEVDLFLPKLEDVTGDLSQRTEEFMATSGRDTWVGKLTNWAASPFSRSFIGTGNASRSDIFENTISSPFYKMGGKVTMNDARALAWLLNVGTGRGDLYGANRYGALLAQPVFSPRLFFARLQHAASPAMLATGIGAPRSLKTAALAAQQLTTFIGSGIAIAAIASQVPGLRSEQNPLSSKWGKIEIGFDPLHPKKETTKVDLFGGYQQYARTIAQLYAAKAKSDSGEIYEKDRWSIFEQFARNKASPNAGMIWDVLSGEYGVGNQKVDLKTAAGIRTFLWNELSPLSFNDIVESVNRDDGFKPQYGVLAPLSTGGMGVQTYGGDTSPGAAIYDIQEFKGIPADMQYDITGKEGFLDRVKKARNELVRTGTPQNKLPKMSASIIEVGEAEGLSKEVIQSALYLNSQKWQQENRTDEWYDFVIDNEEELRESNPDLFSQWLNEFLNLNRDKRVTE